MPGSPVHLFLRFVDYATSPALTEEETRRVASWLRPVELELFLDQPVPDQRHAVHGALSVLEQGSDDPVDLRAVLLHDIGKRHCRLGIWGRSFASILIALRVPLSSRMAAYRDHGEIGAEELREAGSDALVVDFAANHNIRRPPAISPEKWELLHGADRPPKAKTMMRRGISWRRS